MADAAQQQQQQQQQNRMQAPFPTPPPFYKHFTKQNITQLHQAQKQQSQQTSHTAGHPSSEQQPALDILALPTELRYLLPPPPPTNNTWRTFGQTHTHHTADPALHSLSIPQLYPTHPSVHANPAPHLLALARSLLTTFLSLVGQLAQDPTGYEGQTKDLEAIVFNMHDLINRYRPHQARETVILLMEERIGRLRAETGEIWGKRGAVGGLLEGVSGGGEKVGSGGVEVERRVEEGAVEDGRKGRQRAAWAALEREMGREV